jgi:hypothetical protein
MKGYSLSTASLAALLIVYGLYLHARYVEHQLNVEQKRIQAITTQATAAHCRLVNERLIQAGCEPQNAQAMR